MTSVEGAGETSKCGAHRVHIVDEAFGERCRLMREAEQQPYQEQMACHRRQAVQNVILSAYHCLPPG